MTLQADVRAALAGVAALGGRVSYGTNLAQPTVYPHAVFLFVSSVANVALGGPSNVQNTRVQVDVYSQDAGQADTLIDAVTAAMLAAFKVGGYTSQDFPPDPDTKAFRMSCDFSVWR